MLSYPTFDTIIDALDTERTSIAHLIVNMTMMGADTQDIENVIRYLKEVIDAKKPIHDLALVAQNYRIDFLKLTYNNEQQ